MPRWSGFVVREGLWVVGGDVLDAPLEWIYSSRGNVGCRGATSSTPRWSGFVVREGTWVVGGDVLGAPFGWAKPLPWLVVRGEGVCCQMDDTHLITAG